MYTQEVICLKGISNQPLSVPHGLQFVKFDCICLPVGLNLASVKELQIKINGSIIWNISFPLIIKSFPRPKHKNMQLTYANLSHDTVTKEMIFLSLGHVIQLTDIKITGRNDFTEENHFNEEIIGRGIPAFKCKSIEIFIKSDTNFEFEFYIGHIQHAAVSKLLLGLHLPNNPLNEPLKQFTYEYVTYHCNSAKEHIINLCNMPENQVVPGMLVQGILIGSNSILNIDTPYKSVPDFMTPMYRIYHRKYNYSLEVATALWHYETMPNEINEIICGIYVNMDKTSNLYYIPFDMRLSNWFDSPKIWDLDDTCYPISPGNDNINIKLYEPGPVTIYLICKQMIKYHI